MEKVKGFVKKDKSPSAGPNPWHYSVDYLDENGARRLDLSSFDYGSVESDESARECVHAAIQRHANGEEG